MRLVYSELYGGAMIKIIRGKRLHSGFENIGESKKLEFRFHLENKIMKAASLPDFDDVVEMNDPSLIENNCSYYIGFSIIYPNDGIRILDFRKVKEFDEKMS